MTNVISGINIYYYKSIRKPFILFSCRTSCTTISYNLGVTYGKHSSQNRKSGEKNPFDLGEKGFAEYLNNLEKSIDEAIKK